MSLKAKIEAVIYASEEPVTLAQLVGLLGEEGQAKLNGLRSQQISIALNEGHEPDFEAGDQDVLNAEIPRPEMETGDTLATSDAMENSVEGEKKLAREAAQEIKTRGRGLREHFRSLLQELIADYAGEDRGLEIREVAGGYRLATKPEYHDAVRGFVKSLKPPLKLTLQALETLAVVAYKQPVTAPEISEIRGVDSGGVLGGLMARKLVTTAGRKQVIGRPILYKTTKDFLVRFGLKDVSELPSIEEFEKMAGELADIDPLIDLIDPVQEEIAMEDLQEGEDRDASPRIDEINAAPEAAPSLHGSAEEMIEDKGADPDGKGREHLDPHDVEPMADVHEPQADGDSSPTDEEEDEGPDGERKRDAGA
ncbi:MAG: SMC-Scp complex subunit ScpB [Acidobacteriaceae bacterium]